MQKTFYTELGKKIMKTGLRQSSAECWKCIFIFVNRSVTNSSEMEKNLVFLQLSGYRIKYISNSEANDDLRLSSIKKDQRRDLYFIPSHSFYIFVREKLSKISFMFSQ